MDSSELKEYEDPTIEDLVLDITDYSSVMKAETDRKKKRKIDSSS